ncbi:MAG: non-ribosomal peptide synthetase, partial [bacterium]|nr:non-ribosomal peptide synthetase [bacterium]
MAPGGPPEASFYRTGDLACWQPDGNIEFLGRIDSQVKIRGQRVEVGEVENSLLRHPAIKEAVVIVREANGDKTLCAYYELEQSLKPVPGTQLKKYLSHYLPDYMIPQHILHLEKIPLTPNGKIDRKALLENPLPNHRPQTYRAPRDETENQMTEIWTDILGVPRERIGIDTDFFQIGGHSLKATIMAARIHKQLGIRIPLAEIFKNTTIRTLTETIKEKTGSITPEGKDAFRAVKPTEKKDYYILSAAQKRLYILHQMEPESTTYNMPQIIPLTRITTGKTPLPKLEKTIKQLIQRHESLRTTFHIPDTPTQYQITKTHNSPVQRVHDKVEFEIEHYRAEGGTEDKESREAIYKRFFRPFELSKAPLLRMALMETTGTGGPERNLLMDMHHIITDATSQEILTKELFALNAGENLPPLKLQYRDYAEWQNNAKQKHALKQQEEYWIKKYTGEYPILELPLDNPRPILRNPEGKRVEFQLSAGETEKLKKITAENKATLYMVILTLYSVLLSKLSGQEDIIVGTPTAGRRHADFENIIGMFLNTLAMRNKPTGAKTIRDYLAEVKEQTLQAYENQEYQFEELVEKLSVIRDTRRNPLFDTMYNHLNVTTPAKDTPPGPHRQAPTQYHYRKTAAKFDLALTT